MSLLHAVSAGEARCRRSTSEAAYSQGWSLALAVVRSSDEGVNGGGAGEWPGLEFPPGEPLQVIAPAFSLHGSWVAKGKK